GDLGRCVCDRDACSVWFRRRGHDRSGRERDHILLRATNFWVQAALGPSSPSYTIPLGRGVIDRWRTGTMGATPGSQITLLVLEATSSTTYRVVAFDTEQLPNPLPGGNVATFPIANGLPVPAGS